MGKWLEAMVTGVIAVSVCVAVLGHYLPRLTGPLIAVGVLVSVIRVVWFMTR